MLTTHGWIPMVSVWLFGIVFVPQSCRGSESAPDKRQTCADSLGNCEAYGQAACTTYQAWAQHNCPKFCGFCSGGGQTPTDSCVDIIDNCAAIGPNVCQDYVEFSYINCQRTCNFCGSSGPSSNATTTTTCVDKLNNCADYDASSCTGQYAPWARDNCAMTCNLCTQQGTGSQTSSGCMDKLTNCASYDRSTSCTGQYEPWARDNCAKTCNLCSSSTVTGGTQNPGTQTFYSDVCYYKGQSYKEGQQWVDGCDKNCTCVDQRRGYYLCQDLCPVYSSISPQCQKVKQPGECCETLNCPATTGCEYKGEVHPQGEEWLDDCNFKCTCKDASTGYYECQALCVQWNLLPSCTLNPPAPGKCCPTPNCPPDVVIHYPEGYTPM